MKHVVIIFKFVKPQAKTGFISAQSILHIWPRGRYFRTHPNSTIHTHWGSTDIIYSGSNIYRTKLVWTFALCCLRACRVLKIFQIYSKGSNISVYCGASKHFWTWKFICREFTWCNFLNQYIHSLFNIWVKFVFVLSQGMPGSEKWVELFFWKNCELEIKSGVVCYVV